MTHATRLHALQRGPSDIGAAIEEYVDAGYDHVYVHQIGPDQEGFFEFYEREVLPGFS